MDQISLMIERMLRARRIAIVGLSDNPNRPSHDIARYLLKHGYEIVPVNPNCSEVLGLKCASSLAEVDGKIDLVNVFRRSELCEQVTREAIGCGAKGIWLQSGIESDTGAALARQAGIDFVQNRCIKIEHMRAS